MPFHARGTRTSAFALTLAACCVVPVAKAEFIKDSKASLEARNFYFNRDFREGTGQSQRAEWAQGFILRMDSGYTEGVVGVGVDALGLLGIKLDSSKARTGTGLLPVDDNGEPVDVYGFVGLTGKLRASRSELKIGTLIPNLPTLQPNDGRILPQTFLGGILNIPEIDKLKFTLGSVSQVKQRNDDNYEDLALNAKNKRFVGVNSDRFDFAGLDYQIADGLLGRYHIGQLQDVYRQHFLGLQYSRALGSGKLKLDLRYSLSGEAGNANAGEIDNQALNGSVGYGIGGHKFGAAYQYLIGESGFPYIDGSNPYLVNYIQINDFANPEERSWQLRYDYDFVKLGVPGLSFMTRYVSGDNAVVIGKSEVGGEWERNSELQYRFLDGSLKGLGLRLRNATYRSSFARDADETRVILSYALPIW